MVDLFPLAKPFVMALPPEGAHRLTIKALQMGLGDLVGGPPGIHPSLFVNLWGLTFPNPVGLAAGFDKNADVPAAMLKMGFGFTEAGTVTPLAQPGNPKPRLFRLTQDRAVINRMGFNNQGLEAFAGRLRALAPDIGIVGANLGANKTSQDRAGDYETCLRRLYGLADYFTINVSSPNTPGLRGLQQKSELTDLLDRLMKARSELDTSDRPTPMLLKIAPDVSDQELDDIVVASVDAGIDGLIVGNTTLGEREQLKSVHANEQGGLSGAPLFERSNRKLSDAYKLAKGRIPIIGVGGIASGEDAYEKILRGASLVQLYSALVYEGPGLVSKISNELAAFLKVDGFATVGDAVGAKEK